ncbi:MAG: Gfo/Idh/MocA family oxidoreductase [Planctomycetota bacterium]|jgi:predicted dehydrogenase|nr:Gfo/Idh/MocA family oxidoreductase [Planctomycetota bacterium]
MVNEFIDPFGLWKQGIFSGMPPPNIDYLPPKTTFPARIGFIGCDDEAYQILTAYMRADYDVVAISDPNLATAKTIRDTFYPGAKVYADYRDLLADSSVNIVDVSNSMMGRLPLLENCLRAGKHVLSQKYFVDDLDKGEALVRIAKEYGVKFAVNQDARWVPAYRYARNLIHDGYIGKITSVNFLAIWNHNYVKGTPLEEQKYCLPLFGQSWFDLLNMLMDHKPAQKVFASLTESPDQVVKPPLLMHSLVQYEHAQSSISLQGDSADFGMDAVVILGDEGVILSDGAERGEQDLWFVSRKKVCKPHLEGDWLPGGFHGSMAEFIKAIEDGVEPENSAENVLGSLALCFAAIASSEMGRTYSPGEHGARKIGG